MNDDATPSAPTPTPPTPPTSPPFTPSPIPINSPARPAGYWFKRLLACNPFYLVSAALLLYGCYRISTDSGVLHHNQLHLYVNFGSLQLYEFLLMGTAIFLAARQIWYDSTLLVVLENMFLMVPFILMSQGALIGESVMERPLMFLLCAGAGMLAATRLAGLRKYIPELNFNRRALLIVFGFLAVNVALPIVYRTLLDSKVGTQLESGTAYYTNELVWKLLLPGLCALAALVPISTREGGLWPERRMLPAGMFGLWLIGTAAHAYCLGYVYDFNLRGDLVAPSLWLLLWMIRLRAADWRPNAGRVMENALLAAPLAVVFVALISPREGVFLALTLLNAAIYAYLVFVRGNRNALQLLLLSLAILVAAFPLEWGRALFPNFSRIHCVCGVIAGYFFIYVHWSRNPVIGVVGGLIISVLTALVLRDHAMTLHWAIQAGLIFMLGHSLSWEDAKHQGADVCRWLIAVGWALHSLLWMRLGESGWMTFCTAMPIFVAYFALRFFSGQWGYKLVLTSACLSALAGPVNLLLNAAFTMSPGVLAMVCSFVLFGAGTATALLRHRRGSADSGAAGVE